MRENLKAGPEAAMPTPWHLRCALWAAALAATLAGCALPPAAPTAAPPTATAPVRVKVLAINDFHGNLKPPPGGIRIADPADAAKRLNVPAGGAAQMATLLDELRRQNAHHVFVAAGDLVGASPLLSSLLHDEPTIEAMNLMGLFASAMGNHELDGGPAELLRKQNGGCHPKDGCQGPAPFAGAKFQYLAANTVVQATGKTLLPPYAVKRFEGIPVAFIGLTLEGTPNVVTPAGVAGLKFRDEADTVNALVPELRRQGIEAIVVLIHEGGLPTGDYNECPGISGAIVDIVKRMDKAVDLVISGHTHTAYNCVIDGRPVTSAHRYGTLVTQVDLVLDPTTRDVSSAKADNVIVRNDRYAPRPDVAELIAGYEQRVAPLAKRPMGRLAAPVGISMNDAGETAMGQLIADAQLYATRSAGAQLALMNLGGVRGPLGEGGRLELTYEDLFTVQPFYNQLVTVTVSGEQLLSLLNSQYRRDKPRPLQVSRSLAYTWDAARPAGQRVLADSVRIDGKPVAPGDTVRLTVNAFVADGGDDNSVLRQARERTPGPVDIEALEQYVGAHPGLAPDRVPRVTKLN